MSVFGSDPPKAPPPQPPPDEAKAAAAEAAELKRSKQAKGRQSTMLTDPRVQAEYDALGGTRVGLGGAQAKAPVVRTGA